jgi:hypothetical protein
MKKRYRLNLKFFLINTFYAYIYYNLLLINYFNQNLANERLILLLKQI